jgi:4-hydroxy-3-methylbut-2-enyl diphosphate reductase
MKVTLAKSAGFCFGVKRAIDMALKNASCGKNICMLGDIVHNEFVVRQIEKAGIRKIDSLSKGQGRSLLIRAHGIPQALLEKARGLGYQIIDATCPMVKEIHKIVRSMEETGYSIIVIGDKDHDEVRGIIGQLRHKATVIDSPGNMPGKKFKKACVVVQSTQNIEKVDRIIKGLRPLAQELKFFNTICKPTAIRQEEARCLPLKNELMIIIGSRSSANTKRLYEISKRLNPDSHWIESINGLKEEWLKGVKTVGISAGASTPEAVTKEVVAFLKQFRGNTRAGYHHRKPSSRLHAGSRKI